MICPGREPAHCPTPTTLATAAGTFFTCPHCSALFILKIRYVSGRRTCFWEYAS